MTTSPPIAKRTREHLPLHEILDHLREGLRVVVVGSSLATATAAHRRLADTASEAEDPEVFEIRWTNGRQRITHRPSRGEVIFRSHRGYGLHGWAGDVVYLDRVPGEDRDHLADVLTNVVVGLGLSPVPAVVKCDYREERWPWLTAANAGAEWAGALVEARS